MNFSSVTEFARQDLKRSAAAMPIIHEVSAGRLEQEAWFMPLRQFPPSLASFRHRRQAAPASPDRETAVLVMVVGGLPK